jgi:hypothetical protein
MTEEDNKVNEPEVRYNSPPAKKKITFFNSFDEAEEHGLREMAGHSHAERLNNLAVLRMRIYGHLLLPDGSAPPMEKKITVIKASYK